MKKKMTIDGKDPYTFSTIQIINVWNKDKTKVVFTVDHDDTVWYVKQIRDRVQIEKDGKRGWVSFYFLKELKQGWYKEIVKGRMN